MIFNLGAVCLCAELWLAIYMKWSSLIGWLIYRRPPTLKTPPQVIFAQIWSWLTYRYISVL